MAEPTSRLERLRAICLGFPEATEEFTWESPNWRVRKKIFVMTDPEAKSMSCKADPEERVALLEDTYRFFLPAYVGSRGWVGMRLEGKVDWDEVRELVTTSYLRTAPKRLAAQLEVPQ